MKHPDVKIICDLQFGSTGKGLIAGYFAEQWKPDAIAIAWMPNAGHTYINAEGRKFIHTMVPNGVVSPNLKQIFIGPGAMINLDNLVKELEECRDLIGDVRILIHPNAGVVTQFHRDTEDGPMTKIGSTKKGCGAAIIQRIQRDPDNMNTASTLFMSKCPGANTVNTILEKGIKYAVVDEAVYDGALRGCNKLLLEMAQGFSLSIYHGIYPYCTSRDTTPMQGLADTGIPFSWVTDVIGTLRTYPIRVANRYDEEGNMVGWSGPCYADQEETSWDAIGQVPEKTTVTKLQRRVFTFSFDQLVAAVDKCEPTALFLNFCNYLTEDHAASLVQRIEKLVRIPVMYTGWGPKSTDVKYHYGG